MYELIKLLIMNYTLLRSHKNISPFFIPTQVKLRDTASFIIIATFFLNTS